MLAAPSTGLARIVSWVRRDRVAGPRASWPQIESRRRSPSHRRKSAETPGSLAWRSFKCPRTTLAKSRSLLSAGVWLGYA
jgi:hypothetical protein